MIKRQHGVMKWSVKLIRQVNQINFVRFKSLTLSSRICREIDHVQLSYHVSLNPSPVSTAKRYTCIDFVLHQTILHHHMFYHRNLNVIYL